MNEDQPETKQERRDKLREKERKRIPQHGRNLARIYIDAILKRLRGRGK